MPGVRVGRGNEKRADGIGYDNKHKEIVVIECSGSFDNTSSTHAREYAAKIIEQCFVQLREMTRAYLDASWATMQKKKCLGIHLIGRRMTLTYTGFNFSRKARHMELQSATVPVEKSDFPTFVNFFKLLATMIVSLVQVCASCVPLIVVILDSCCLRTRGRLPSN